MSSWGVKPQGILRIMLKSQSVKGQGKPLKYFEHGSICNLEKSYTCYLCRTDCIEGSPRECWKTCQQALESNDDLDFGRDRKNGKKQHGKNQLILGRNDIFSEYVYTVHLRFFGAESKKRIILPNTSVVQSIVQIPRIAVLIPLMAHVGLNQCNGRQTEALSNNEFADH